VLDHSDIQDHRTQTGNYANETCVCKVKLSPFRTLQHYRLVLREIGGSLTLFSHFRDVLAAMCDALQGEDTYLTTILPLRDLAAHRESYYDVFHRDISAGNIIIYDGGGLLIDWDRS
jgi:thiamine kinase-like enzyme